MAASKAAAKMKSKERKMSTKISAAAKIIGGEMSKK